MPRAPDACVTGCGYSPGALALDYGIEDSGRPDELCFSIGYAGRPPQRLRARGAGQLYHGSFDPPRPSEPASVTIEVSGRAPRALCIDGRVDR